MRVRLGCSLALAALLGLAAAASAAEPVLGVGSGGQAPTLVIDSGGHTTYLREILFTHDGRYLASADADKVVRVWSVESGESIRTLRLQLQQDDGQVSAMALSPDDRYLAIGVLFAPEIRLYDFQTGALVTVFHGHVDSVVALAFSPDGRLLASTSFDTTVRLWDISSHQSLHVLRPGNSCDTVAFSPDGTRVVSGSWDRTLRLWNAKNGELIRKMEGLEGIFSEDGRYIASGRGHDKGVRLWDAATGALVKEFGRNQGEVRVLSFTPDGKRMVVRGYKTQEAQYTVFSVPDGKPLGSFEKHDNLVTLYDSETGKPIHERVMRTDAVWAVAVSSDGKWLASGSEDQTVRLWDLATGANLLSFFVATDGEWVAWTPQGYYTSSLHGDRYVGWQVNRGPFRAAKYYSAAQFAPQFYRPDVVAEYLKDGDIQKALARANARRGPGAEPAMTVASIETILPPIVYVEEPGQDGLVVDNETLRVKAAALSNNLPITDLRVTVNGIQVAGLPEGTAKGEPLRRKVEIQVTLRPGENVLSFQAAHAKARSESQELHVTYRQPVGTHTAAPAKPNLILLAIGISDYSDPPLKLSWAAEDARQVYESFKRQEGKLFGHVEARLLPEAKGRVGRSEILSALHWFEAKGADGDVRILFLSGHGTLDPNHDFYFLSQDQSAAGDPENDSIRWSRLLDSLTAGPVHPILLVDACHAGAAAKGPARARVDLTEVIKRHNNVYPNLVTFTASSGTELSVERDEWRHGAFTSALLEGLAGKADGLGGGKKDGTIDTLELGNWLSRRVAELTGDAQHANFDSGGAPPFPLFQVEP